MNKALTQEQKDRLKFVIREVIPSDAWLTPTKGKAAFIKDYYKKEKQALDREWLCNQIQNTQGVTGFGWISCGKYWMIDIDGPLARKINEKICPQGMPETLAWASGRIGRGMYVFQLDLKSDIPEKYRKRFDEFTNIKLYDFEDIHIPKEKDGIEGPHEIRHQGSYAVCFPSYRPDLGKEYDPISLVDQPIANLPQEIIDWLINHFEAEDKAEEDKKAESLARKAQRVAKQVTSNLSTLPNDLHDLIKETTQDSSHWQTVYQGFSPNSEDKENYIGYCSFHGGKSGTSLKVHKNTGRWICFGGCGEGHYLEYLWCEQNGSGPVPQSAFEGSGYFEYGKKLLDRVGVPWKHLDIPRQQVTLNPEGLLQEIDKLIDLDLKPSEVSAKLLAIANKYGKQTAYVEKIYRERLAEREQSEDSINTSTEVEKLLKADTDTLDLETIIPADLAKSINKLAELQNLRPEAFVTILLGVVSSLVKPATSLKITEDWDDLSANFFSAVVAEPSQRKSAIFSAITGPLKQLEKEAREQHKKQMQIYQEHLAAWEAKKPEDRGEKPQEPKRRVFAFGNCTAEGLRNQIAGVPGYGILQSTDELAGMFKGLNAYRGGKGSDSEEMLSAYDGTYALTLRASGLVADLDRIGLGIVGTIQPKVLESLIGSDDDDSSGKWARFAFCRQPLTALTRFPDPGEGSGLKKLLIGFYRGINDMPATQYRLSLAAYQLFEKRYMELEQQRTKDPRAGMRAVWGKTEGRIAKIALILHHLNSTDKDGFFIVKDEIPQSTVKAAIALSDFYANQIEALYGSLGNGEGLASHLAKVIDLSRAKGWITASDVRRGMRSACSSTTIARQWFTELASMGRGVLEGEGRYLKFKATDKSMKVAPNVVGKVASTLEANNPYPVRDLEDKSTEVVEVATVVDFPKNNTIAVEVDKSNLDGGSAPTHEKTPDSATFATATISAESAAPTTSALSTSVATVGATFEESPPKKPDGVPRNGVVGDLVAWHRWLCYATGFPYSIDDFGGNEILIGDSCWQMTHSLDDKKLQEQLTPIFWPYSETLANVLMARHTG